MKTSVDDHGDASKTFLDDNVDFILNLSFENNSDESRVIIDLMGTMSASKQSTLV